MQFAWDLVDVSAPGDFCRGKHTKTEFIVDNVSIGYFDAHATDFSTRTIDLLHDTFFDNLCAFNSLFRAYHPDTVSKYSGPPYDDITLPKTRQLYLDVIDDDGLVSVELYGSIDEGTAWTPVGMTIAQYHDPDHPEEGGEYYGTLCPTDFGLDTWPVGTEVWYYVKAVDELSHEEYYPRTAKPTHPDHTGEAWNYFTFSILPIYPETYTGPRVLLVNGYPRRNYDFSPCLSALEEVKQVYKIYEQALADAGYCFDRYDITGGGSNIHIHPIWYDDYDVIVWFTGPYYSNYLVDKKAQQAIRDYLGGGGKFIFAGDRLAYCMSPTGVGEDSLDGEFLGGILGSDYLSEMPSPFTYPYMYAVGVDTVSVFGSPVEIDLDTLLVYRECPYLKDMSYIAVNDSPPAGYTAQRLMYISNPTIDAADHVIYTEYLGVGQCAFIDFDLCACVNSEAAYCTGDAPYAAPDFAAGTYCGRAELLRTILEDIFGLPSNGSGGPADIVQPPPAYQWALGQNIPNPCVASTVIRYGVGHRAKVRLTVYNALGQVVRVLEDGDRAPGKYQANWDGRNAYGDLVSSGVYFYQLEAGGFRATRKMLLLH
jgi:hypothetical protein